MKLNGNDLSCYVIEVGDQLYDTMQRKYLPLNPSTEELRTGGFLAEQEEKVLLNTVFQIESDCRLLIVPTWQCNLRCTHCYVQHELNDCEGRIDLFLLEKFITQYKQYYPMNKGTLLFVGGEPLLATHTIATMLKLPVLSNFIPLITTNLCVDLNQEILDILSKMEIINVSVDGPDEKSHNNQRKSSTISNPFKKTIENIKVLMTNGFRNKLCVQCASSDGDSVYDYYKCMLKLGFKTENITFGSTCPSPQQPKANDLYLNTLKIQPLLLKNRCCKYRFMRNFLIDNNNKIYTDFYVRDELGDLSSSLESIKDNYAKSIISEMPILHDVTCKQCPILGHCWGYCSINNFFFNGRPSQHCNRDKLLKSIVYSLMHNITKYEAFKILYPDEYILPRRCTHGS